MKYNLGDKVLILNVNYYWGINYKTVAIVSNYNEILDCYELSFHYNTGELSTGLSFKEEWFRKLTKLEELMYEI